MTPPTTPVPTHATEVRDHWWWRPGWREGREFYTWHLTFPHAHELHQLVERYQEQLAGLPQLDMVPREWLHLTMQGIGFADEISEDDARQVAEAAQGRLAKLPSPQVTFNSPLLRPEALVLPATPAEPIAEIRDAIGNAIAEVRGSTPEEPSARHGYVPHITLAYINADGPAEPIVNAAKAVQADPVSVPVRDASLIILNRDHRMYQWRPFVAAPIGEPTPT